MKLQHGSPGCGCTGLGGDTSCKGWLPHPGPSKAPSATGPALWEEGKSRSQTLGQQWDSAGSGFLLEGSCPEDAGTEQGCSNLCGSPGSAEMGAKRCLKWARVGETWGLAGSCVQGWVQSGASLGGCAPCPQEMELPRAGAPEGNSCACAGVGQGLKKQWREEKLSQGLVWLERSAQWIHSLLEQGPAGGRPSSAPCTSSRQGKVVVPRPCWGTHTSEW